MRREAATARQRQIQTLYRHIWQQIEVGCHELEQRDKCLTLLTEIWEGGSGEAEIHLRGTLTVAYLTLRQRNGLEAEVTGGSRYSISEIEAGFEEIMVVIRQIRAEFDVVVTVGEALS